jgi:hypothetical protein
VRREQRNYAGMAKELTPEEFDDLIERIMGQRPVVVVAGKPCGLCNGTQWVCEDRRTKPWDGRGAGVPCPWCNPMALTPIRHPEDIPPSPSSDGPKP